ncbi:hypothetical protein PPL_07239 [Heterostelium album PN500]|uniref:Uncharacterized protein n=1 Tax=Heterostelium pallidum (strain ATCC 26659 / Pp 5 / PN500) TaxID=670386 RepID=D3BES4_HETP5|nr:hypothetical protein PPL_07239 [Heterostelium album PN500]EFA80405.1 hypothetical protein PPL_07239 [Heterostelium album PN500]|eukprot:XP_020432525.1 hypothetical protein PPL_07239 [Heterostelium album PN500]
MIASDLVSLRFAMSGSIDFISIHNSLLYQFNQESIYNQTCKKNADIIICLPDDMVNFKGIVMAIYSYIPVVVFIVLAIWYIIRRTIVPILVLATLGLTLLLNEAILKNIIKQPRPPGSCACS